jgi:hypothetical protein
VWKKIVAQSCFHGSGRKRIATLPEKADITAE